MRYVCTFSIREANIRTQGGNMLLVNDLIIYETSIQLVNAIVVHQWHWPS